MPKIIFQHPEFDEMEIYAPAGSHKKTVLELAKEFKVPIHFDCGDGECGSCVIKVSDIDGGPTHMGVHMTDKEKNVLQEQGKLSRDELEKVIVNDMPSDWRLACQMIVRDEDIRITYESA
ncbi:2Fe-2S iron-sulfur cluster binding domain-containing protein [Cohaesibacter marisflavi]|uniref:2Fe-2S iron-sulfur cluster binding domain-containing protein n=1 Tax=Cohaesibacter marisflavi TaxID=655353 RepID=A0A1I5AHU8_9HYPH|nr:2Fe-2S iron-sulfur cluster binding domain-containing protein [Cohaesibacter marisflavi]SFN62007.1 2Fe-2S iron-sulfur cluster binding domain-containing protein [Cohaesibacter marisflavi]